MQGSHRYIIQFPTLNLFFLRVLWVLCRGKAALGQLRPLPWSESLLHHLPLPTSRTEGEEGKWIMGLSVLPCQPQRASLSLMEKSVGESGASLCPPWSDPSIRVLGKGTEYQSRVKRKCTPRGCILLSLPLLHPKSITVAAPAPPASQEHHCDCPCPSYTQEHHCGCPCPSYTQEHCCAEWERSYYLDDKN